MLPLVCVKWRVCFKERINPHFHRPGNLKGVAGFRILTELLPLIDESGTLLLCALSDYMWSWHKTLCLIVNFPIG